MGGFDNAKMVKINNKEVDSIKTNDGRVIYQRPIIITFTGKNVQLESASQEWLPSTGDIVIDWGDNSTNTINNSTTNLRHTYTDNLSEHTIVFLGIVTEVGNDYFYNCTGLKSIIIPNSVTSLGEACFYGCTGLTSITIPNSVTSLGEACFYDCTNLTSVTIPSGVTSLGDYCFYACSNLNTYQLYWISSNIITYDSNKMPNYTNTKFYVPKGQKTNYINKGYPSDKVIERS